MTDLTRRGFVKNSASAAAGVAALTVLTEQSAVADAEVARSGPIVAYVSDARRGEIAVMHGDREVTVRDRKLAASIVRAAR